MEKNITNIMTKSLLKDIIFKKGFSSFSLRSNNSLNLYNTHKFQFKLNEANNLEIKRDLPTNPFLYEHSDKYQLEKNYKNVNNNASFDSIINTSYDAIVIGAGHNGLICANYLAKDGKKVLVLEKRHTVGGAANSEELIEGYKFSRCSYVLALFRKKIIDELFADDFFQKIKLHKRNPKGFIPTKKEGLFLRRFNEKELLIKEIAKFSEKDSINFVKLDNFLTKMVKIIEPLIDINPIDAKNLFAYDNFLAFKGMLKGRKDIGDFYHFLTSSAQYYLDMYLENDLLKGYYATDAVIGAMKSPLTPGSAYVLLHHVMGELDEEGNWFYVEGGNGALSKYIADKAIERGVKICLNSSVKKLVIKNGKVTGVVTESGKEISSKIVISNIDMNNTYFKLLDENQRTELLTPEMLSALKKIEYNSPVFKINLIVKRLPRFNCLSNIIKTANLGSMLTHSSEARYHHEIARNYFPGTIHMNSESISDIDKAYLEALNGTPSSSPMIEMTIPSILDQTLTPRNSGHHVLGLFCQFAPYKLKNGEKWDYHKKRAFADKVYSEIEKYAEGFTDNILFEDLLSPLDLEETFSLTGGNIFQGAMDINSISFCRPTIFNSRYHQPIENLFSCGSAMHPGGGVMGAPGRNCALMALKKI